jgi:hypothetical protein
MTLAEARRRLRKFKDDHNAFYEACRRGKKRWDAFERFFEKNDRERAAFVRGLRSDPELKNEICDRELYFQGKDENWNSNGSLGARLAKKFPSGVDGSEIEAGYFYINQSKLGPVLAFLKGKTRQKPRVRRALEFLLPG